MTVAATLRRRGKSVLQYLSQAILAPRSGTAAPSLLSQ